MMVNVIRTWMPVLLGFGCALMPLLVAYYLHDTTWDICGVTTVEGRKGRDEEVYMCASPWIALVLAGPGALVGTLVGIIIGEGPVGERWWEEEN